MKYFKITILALSLVVSSQAFAYLQTREPYGQVRGFYTHGSLSHSSTLPLETSTFVEVLPERHRNYGSQGMIELIKRVTTEYLSMDPTSEKIQIGDIANLEGGPAHISHQNGLDADIVYLRKDHAVQPAHDYGTPTGFRDTFVHQGRLDTNFDIERNWKFISLLMESGRIDIIIVDSVIKQAFCGYALKSGQFPIYTSTLSRLVDTEDLHDTHMHVRLSCPAASPECRSNPATANLNPNDHGCGSSLKHLAFGDEDGAESISALDY